jgi:phosphohistidine swiveling domain-containing protein
MFVRDLRDADPACGGKAVGLARLIAAGLPVPQGFVIDAFRDIVGELEISDPESVGHVFGEAAERIMTARLPPELDAEVRERARGLGTSFAVRSSATIEDGPAGAGAGVFSSQTEVPLAELWTAIRIVWATALTPLAAAYARHRSAGIAIGVIVQEFVDGERITVYTRPPGRPDADEILVQHGEQLTRFHRADRDPPNQALLALHHAALLALRAERAIDAIAGADVELVQRHIRHAEDSVIETWIVQARPIVHSADRTRPAPPPFVLLPLQDGRVWTWDVAHNPDPLSTAQAGLVERVEQAGYSAYSLRVCGGYLYTSPRESIDLPSVTTERELADRSVVLEAELERALASWPPASPSEAIERYLAFYRIWATQLAPLITAARAVLPRALRESGHADPDAIAARLIGHRPSAVEVTLACAARGELDEREVMLQLGALSPAWDVAVPTFGERPGLLADAITRAKQAAETATDPRSTGHASQPLPAAPPEYVHFAEQIALARAAADLAERDDAYFSRAQFLVRKALLARAEVLGISAEDVFWLPIEELVAIDPDAARRRASAERAAASRAAHWQMPVVVGGSDVPRGAALRGVGTGPRVAGRVVRFATLASAVAVGAGDVVVTRAVTPALAVLVIGCAALVSETGGLLDHGAALARELGIPCVVGCRDAWSRLDDGMLVTVDGEQGTVEIG